MVERSGYDAVLCHGVLEYVDDPAEGVRNAVDALRPSGELSLLAAGLGGAVLARALAGHFTEARRALSDPAGRWGAGDPVPRRYTAEQLTELVSATDVEVGAVHGVRVFADLVPGVLVDTEPGAMEALLKLETAVAELPAVPLGRDPAARSGHEARLSRGRGLATGSAGPGRSAAAARLISNAAADGVRHRPPIGAQSPYDRGTPSGMTDRMLGNLRLSS